MVFAPAGLAVSQSASENSKAANVAPLGQGYLLVRSRLRITQDGGQSLLAVPDRPSVPLQSRPASLAVFLTPQSGSATDVSEVPSVDISLPSTPSCEEQNYHSADHNLREGNAPPPFDVTQALPHSSPILNVRPLASRHGDFPTTSNLLVPPDGFISDARSLPNITQYARLLSFLEEQHRAGVPRVTWTTIGVDRSMYPSLYPAQPPKLKALLQQAEADKVLEIGDADRPGYEWATALTLFDASQSNNLPEPASSRKLPTTQPSSSFLSSPAKSTSQGTTATSTSSTQPFSGPSAGSSSIPAQQAHDKGQSSTAGGTQAELRDRWNGLVTYLHERHQAGQMRVVLTQIGDYRSAHLDIFQHLPKKMKDLVMEAHAHGVVLTGGDGADRWVQLSPTFTVASDLVGLVGFLEERLRAGEKRVKWKDIGEHRVAHPSSYPTEPRRLKPFLEFARDAGVIKCGQSGQGQEWAELVSSFR
jgi:hypothetical protein